MLPILLSRIIFRSSCDTQFASLDLLNLEYFQVESLFYLLLIINTQHLVVGVFIQMRSYSLPHLANCGDVVFAPTSKRI